MVGVLSSRREPDWRYERADNPPGAVHGLPGSCMLVWSFAAARGKYKIYYFVPHLLQGEMNFVYGAGKL